MTEKYILYVGDKIRTVSLWVRRNDKEYPIYANSRGKCEWYTFDTDVYENVEPEALSGFLIEWLAFYHRLHNGIIDADSEDSMFLAEKTKQPDEPPQFWYELELLNAVGQPDYTPEQEELLEWAYNEVEQ